MRVPLIENEFHLFLIRGVSMMERNVGSVDSLIRYLIGAVAAVIVVLSFSGILSLGPVLMGVVIVLGLISVFTARTRRCGVYSVLNLNTSRDKQADKYVPED